MAKLSAESRRPAPIAQRRCASVLFREILPERGPFSPPPKRVRVSGAVRGSRGLTRHEAREVGYVWSV